MARKTAMDKLTADIIAILNKYEDDVTSNVMEIADALAKKGAKALRAKSRETFNGTGEYAKGWKVETTGKQHRQLTWSSVIYNEHPGMPHLLEHGHVSRNGTKRTFGRVPGYEHIKPVADELVETFEREVVSKL